MGHLYFITSPIIFHPLSRHYDRSKNPFIVISILVLKILSISSLRHHFSTFKLKKLVYLLYSSNKFLDNLLLNLLSIILRF